MTTTKSRNQREGAYFGKIARRHRRGSSWPKTDADYKPTRAARRYYRFDIDYDGGI